MFCWRTACVHVFFVRDEGMPNAFPFNTLSGIAGPPVMVLYTAMNIAKETVRGTNAWTNLLQVETADPLILKLLMNVHITPLALSNPGPYLCLHFHGDDPPHQLGDLFGGCHQPLNRSLDRQLGERTFFLKSFVMSSSMLKTQSNPPRCQRSTSASCCVKGFRKTA